MSQVKIEKFATGGGITTPQEVQKPVTGRKLRFKANGQLIDMDESLFASEYEKFANDLGGKGKNRGDWDQSYNSLINNISKGQETGNYYDFKVGDNRSTDISYSGQDLSNTERGVKDSGKTAKIGLFSGITGEQNDAARMAALNEWAGGVVARGVQFQNNKIKSEQDTRIAELKAEAEKLKAEQDATLNANLTGLMDNLKFDNFFGRSLDGSKMSMKQQYELYHKDPSAQDGFHRDYLNRVRETVNNPLFATEAGKKAFAQMFPGSDQESFINTVKNVDLSGKFNAGEIYKKLGWYGQYATLNDRSGWDTMQKAKQLEDIRYQNALNSNTPQENSTSTSETEANQNVGDLQFADNIDFTNYLDAKTTYKGVPMKFGDILNNFRTRNNNGTLTQDDKDYWEKYITPALSKFESVYKNPNSVEGVDPYEFNGYVPINKEELWNLDKEYRQNPYQLFNTTNLSEIPTLQDVISYKDITADFTGLVDKYKGDNGYRNFAITEEILKPRAGENLSRKRYRVLGPNKNELYTQMSRRNDGTYELIVYSDAAKTRVKERINLGKVGVNRTALEKRMPFNYGNKQSNQKPQINQRPSNGEWMTRGLGRYQEGGQIEKYQEGSKFSISGGASGSSSNELLNLKGAASNLNTKSKTLGIIDQISGNQPSSDAEKMELAALAADIVGLGASFAPGGGVVTGVAGLGSSLAHARASAIRGEDWGGELAINAGLDVLTAIPIAGGLSKSVKIGRSLKRMLKSTAGLAMLGAGGANVVDAAKKIVDGDYSAENFKTLVGGLTTVLGGKRMTLDNKLAYKNTKNADINLKADGKDVKFRLSEPQIDALESKSLTQQKDYITGLFKKANPNAVEVELPSVMKRRYLGMVGPKKETGVKLDIEKGTELRDYDTSNWFQQRAIKRQVKMNPGLNPINYDGSSKFKTNVITYGGMGNNKGFRITDESRMLPIGTTSEPIQYGQKTAFKEGFKPRAEVQEVDGRSVKTKPTTESSNTVHTAEHLPTTKRNENLAKGRQPGPKIHAANRKALIAENNLRKKGLNTYPEDATNVNPMQGPKSLNYKEVNAYAKGATEVKPSKTYYKNSDKPRFSDAELKNIRKSLGLKANVETNLDLNALINPSSQRDKKIANKLVKIAQSNSKLSKYLDNSLELLKDKPNAKLKLQNGGVVKAENGLKFFTKNKVSTPDNPIFYQAPTVNAGFKTPSFTSPKKNLYSLSPTNTNVTPNLDPIADLKNSWSTSPKAPTSNRIPFDLNIDALNTGVTEKTALQNKWSKPNVQAALNTTATNANALKIEGVEKEIGGNPPSRGFKYDPLALSEFGRALANRKAHGRLDTRAGAVIMDAPVQVSPTVRGDLIGQQAFQDAATNIEQVANRPFASDAGVNLAGRLSASTKANQMRVQGAAANANAIRQQEAQALQSEQQYANIRSEIANRNKGSIANRIQSERIAKNTRDAAMFKSMDNFWAEQNRQGYQERMRMQPLQDRQNQIKAQMADFTEGEFKGSNYSTIGKQLVEQMNDVNVKLQTTTDPVQRTTLMNELNTLRGKSGRLEEANMLRLSDPKLYNEKYGLNFVNLPKFNRLNTRDIRVQSNKKGGRLSMEERIIIDKEKQKDKMIFDWYKEYNSFIKEQLKADMKSNSEGQKLAAKFAENALKTK